MTDSHKFIIAKNGYHYTDADIRNILFHSDYKLLKQFIELSGTLNFTAGDTHKTLSINHNLGYVPAYIPFLHWPDFYDSIVKYYLIPMYASGTFGELAIDSFVDSTKIQLNIDTPDIYKRYFPEWWNYIELYSNDDYYWLSVGNENGNGRDGAIRFSNIDLTKNQSITSATLNFYMSARGSSNQDVKIQTWGIDEDDCGEIWGNLGREKTSARTAQNVSAGTLGEYFGINVTDQVREIIARNGWASGNHMGFYVFNDGSPNDAFRRDSDYQTYLEIVLPGNHTMYFKAVIFVDKIL